MWKLSPALLLAICFAQAAAAHAQIDKADPPADATVIVAPASVTLNFTEEIEPRFSGIEVRNEKGERIDLGEAHLDSPRSLRVPLGHLTPGTYTVAWHVVAVDTHRSRGSYVFSVAP